MNGTYGRSQVHAMRTGARRTTRSNAISTGASTTVFCFDSSATAHQATDQA